MTLALILALEKQIKGDPAFEASKDNIVEFCLKKNWILADFSGPWCRAHMLYTAVSVWDLRGADGPDVHGSWFNNNQGPE